LGFEEVVGDGKNLSLQDIRFARTINRIQKCMLAELNKIAIIHLFLLGFEDEISNFTLGLSNPSTQSDLLKIDVWKEKVLLYKDLVADPGNGIQATSSTWAKKHIFNFSDDEIRTDLLQQRLERAIGEELKQTPTVITKTGLFDNIDKLYGGTSGTTGGAVASTEPEMGGGFGGGEITSPEPSLGPETGGAPPPAGPEETAGVTPESNEDRLNLLVENNYLVGSRYLNLEQGQDSLGEIEKELDKLLNS
jgi:hypothetical protein